MAATPAGKGRGRVEPGTGGFGPVRNGRSDRARGRGVCWPAARALIRGPGRRVRPGAVDKEGGDGRSGEYEEAVDHGERRVGPCRKAVDQGEQVGDEGDVVKAAPCAVTDAGANGEAGGDERGSLGGNHA